MDGLRQEPRRDLCDRSFAFAAGIVLFCKPLLKTPGASPTLGKQLLRSATSVGANIEEAQAGQSRADFRSKYSIALKEARETHYWLRLLAATGCAPQKDIDPLQEECNQLIAILTTIVRKTKD